MQGHHLLPVIWSVIYLLLFGSVKVFRSCGFAGSPLDGSNMFKHAQTVQTFFCGYKAIPTVKRLIVVAWYFYFWLTDPYFELQNITNKNASNMSYVFWGRNFFIGCWTWAQSHRFQLPRARWWPCCRTFVFCSATRQNGAGIEGRSVPKTSTESNQILKSRKKYHHHFCEIRRNIPVCLVWEFSHHIWPLGESWTLQQRCPMTIPNNEISVFDICQANAGVQKIDFFKLKPCLNMPK